MRFKVLQNKEGRLSLVVLSGNKAVWARGGYEHRRDALREDVQALVGGANPLEEWTGKKFTAEDPDELYRAAIAEDDFEVVAVGREGRLKIHKARVGSAAREAFDISDEEHEIATAAAALGKIGGRSRSKAKRQAARENGATYGGRPKEAS